jgi:hypothetical protein
MSANLQKTFEIDKLPCYPAVTYSALSLGVYFYYFPYRATTLNTLHTFIFFATNTLILFVFIRFYSCINGLN